MEGQEREEGNGKERAGEKAGREGKEKGGVSPPNENPGYDVVAPYIRYRSHTSSYSSSIRLVLF